MTPFQKLGFQVGDEVIYTGNRIELLGKRFIFQSDDGSEYPLFRSVGPLRDYPWGYVFVFGSYEIIPCDVVEANE